MSVISLGGVMDIARFPVYIKAQQRILIQRTTYDVSSVIANRRRMRVQKQSGTSVRADV